MSDALGQLGGLFGGGDALPTWGKIALGGLGGAGEIGNILNAVQRHQQVGRLEAAEKKFTDLTPEQFSGMVSKAQKPLEAGLVQSVGNTVQAEMATRGLAQAPGIFAATESQALAPYALEEQKLALTQVLQQLGLPIQYAQAILGSQGKDTNLLPILLAMMRGGGGGGSVTGGIPDTSGIPSNVGDILSGIIGGGDFGGTSGGGDVWSGGY